jgi:hypothetical protein
MDELRVRDPLSADWVLLVLMAVLMTLVWINLVSPKKWRLFVRSFFSVRLGRQSLRDEVDIQDRTLVGAALMASGVVALFAYQVLVLQGVLTPGLLRWLELWGVAAGVLTLQFLVVRLGSRLFNTDQGATEYGYTLLLMHVMMGLLFIPLTMVMAYPHKFEWRPGLVLAGLVLAAAVIVFRWVRAFIIALGEGVSLRYIFLYLCAAEILPFALLMQQAQGQFPHQLH